MSGFTSYIGSVSVDTGLGSSNSPPMPDVQPGEIVISSAHNVFCFAPCLKEQKSPLPTSKLNRDRNLTVPKQWSPKPTRKGSFRRRSHLRTPSPLVPESRQRRVKSWFGQTPPEMEDVKKSGKIGSLFVTTLKLSFKPEIPNTSLPSDNKIIKEFEIPLSSIYAIYEISGEVKEKKKRLQFGSTSENKNVEGLFIICKNFKCMKFSFNVSDGDINGRKITNSLLHHSRPQHTDLLFAFSNKLEKNPAPSRKASAMFKKKPATIPSKQSVDWRQILKDSQSPNCRISQCNESWQISTSLPPRFIVPSHTTDSLLASMAGIGQGSRPPVWVWGTKPGGAIYIQPALAVPPTQNTENLEKTFYNNENVTLLDLDKILPSQIKLEESLASMLSLHCVDSMEKLLELDCKYLSLLECAGWVSTLSSVLELSVQVAESVYHGNITILQEGDSRNTSLLVASVAQILLDDKFRTRKGFESLIQSNWISLGFPFAQSHALSGDGDSVNPTFLLFLDCVHQISIQFPSSLAFNQEYLVSVWDTALLPIFETFIFNNEYERAKENSTVQLRSAWDWGQLFSQAKIDAWDNPLYGVPISLPTRNSCDPSEASMAMIPIQSFPEIKEFLPIHWQVASLAIWDKLFHRSLKSVHGMEKDSSGEDGIILMRKKAKKAVLDAHTVQ